MGRINVSEQHLFVENPKSMSVSVPWRFSFKYGVTKVCVAVLSSAKLKVTKESTTSNLLLWLLNLPQTRINVHTICLDIPWILNTSDIVSVCYNRWKRAKHTGAKLDRDPPGSLNLKCILLFMWLTLDAKTVHSKMVSAHTKDFSCCFFGWWE